MGTVELKTEDGIAIITLNAPQKLNALTNSDFFQIGTLLEEIGKRGDIFITVLIGIGRFFSAGADIEKTASRDVSKEEADRYYLERMTANILRNTRAFYRHPKILITILNGPVLGLPAAFISLSDFIYATEDVYLSMPFVSLGVVSEGAASFALAQRLGITKANEVLIQGKRLPAAELLRCNFVNEILPWKGDSEEFRTRSISKVRRDFSLVFSENSLAIKALIRRPYLRTLDDQTLEEALQQGRRFAEGIPQKKFAELAAKKRRNKI